MAANIAQEVTARILEQLKAGTCPWKQPWTGTGSGLMPRNAVTGRAYSGVNVLLLWSTAAERGYASPGWLTFKQALDAGGHVRKGEKGTRVVFVSTFDKKDKTTGEVERRPFLKSFTVFNRAQCDGLSLESDVVIAAKHDEMRDADSDAFIASTGAVIAHGEGRAYYRPSTDSIMLPGFETFTGAGTYYATCFHELGHWTGAESRLARTFGKRFGDDAYAAEELVAELTSAFILAELGFAPTGFDAAYIAHWVKFLTDHETAIMTAASAASKALAYLKGLALAEETQDEQIAA
jgi:antirestriction protein ArdC